MIYARSASKSRSRGLDLDLDLGSSLDLYNFFLVYMLSSTNISKIGCKEVQQEQYLFDMSSFFLITWNQFKHTTLCDKLPWCKYNVKTWWSGDPLAVMIAADFRVLAQITAWT